MTKRVRDAMDWWDTWECQLELSYISFGWKDIKRQQAGESIPKETKRDMFNVFHRIGVFLFVQLKSKEELKKMGIKVYGNDGALHYAKDANDWIQVVDLDSEHFEEAICSISAEEYNAMKDKKKVKIDGRWSYEYRSEDSVFSGKRGYRRMVETPGSSSLEATEESAE